MTGINLPSNPRTIDDLRPQANTWTAEHMEARYGNRVLDGHAVKSILRDLNELRAWDAYERMTSAHREASKRVLEKYLALAQERHPPAL